MFIPLITLGVFALILIIVYFSIYNSLVGKKNDVENAFAGMDVQLKKRYDLIPNLVDSAKKYMQHEREVLEKVTAMRQRALQGGRSPDDQVAVENNLTGALRGLMVAVENYPELKADSQFDQLMRSLNEVESQISASRRAYNAAVTDFNNGVEMFPSSIVANMMKYKTRTLFVIPETERQNLDVGNLFNQN
ncbi:MAG: LemA family protein [Acidobacteria bacterium]|nr:MAG: LemA family protein [Acidobacteriota bacterium]